MAVSNERILEGVVAGLILAAILAGLGWAVHSCDNGRGKDEGPTAIVDTPPASSTYTSSSSQATKQAPTENESTGSPSGEFPVPSIHASWRVADCRLNRDYGHPQVTATVYVKNKDELNEHTYTLLVIFGDSSNRIATDYVYVDDVKPLETGKNQVIDDNPSVGAQQVPNGPVACRVAEITDYDTGGVVRP